MAYLISRSSTSRVGKNYHISNTQEEIEAFEEAFELFDKDGDKFICFEELKECFASLNIKITDQELKIGIKAVDKDGNGTLDLEEFKTLLEMKQDMSINIDPVEELQQVFNIFDKDGDGQISAKEIHTVLLQFGQNLSEDEIALMINEADKDSDGQVDFNEFQKLMKFK
eukprot:TRINITY_DN12394_c0_g1_i1.p1 TRINITY_DN12394_c0_g1~~TRINITY_DN12394_c0_g1_i1.p1  ORF type:complete len:169 (-),score=68.01 TRINITY_DN12394_c0_g1_i1:118-624(-)